MTQSKTKKYLENFVCDDRHKCFNIFVFSVRSIKLHNQRLRELLHIRDITSMRMRKTFQLIDLTEFSCVVIHTLWIDKITSVEHCVYSIGSGINSNPTDLVVTAFQSKRKFLLSLISRKMKECISMPLVSNIHCWRLTSKIK